MRIENLDQIPQGVKISYTRAVEILDEDAILKNGVSSARWQQYVY